MDYSTYSSVMTVVMFAVFMGIVAWACSGKRCTAFDEAARIPLEEDLTPDDRNLPGEAERTS